MMSAVLPADLYDNDPLADRILVRDRDAFGADEPVPVLRARRQGTPSALVLRATARGYVGPIRLLIGVRDDGTVLGVRVTRHQETPGFGDGIEPSHGDWITRFAGRSLDAPAPERWAVRADGGDFDQFSGATITPRAIVTQVRKVLEYVALHRDALFANDAAASRIAP
jgi:electron transport complex protein RnfG